MNSLVELDSLEAVVIIDNELDPLSSIAPGTVVVGGRMSNIVMSQPDTIHDRGGAKKELPMEAICCGAHGLSILLTATKGDIKHTMLFDTGPEEDVWEKNVKRLGLDLALVERIQLSHWHRDHSGGMLRAVDLITQARSKSPGNDSPLIVDLHPSRPEYRGIMLQQPVSFQADPSFEELESHGGLVEKHADPHTVLDDMFLVSGEIPRVTTYEKGVRFGIRYHSASNKWESDELIQDERFLMCNVKGKGIVMFTGCSHAGVVNASRNSIELLGGSVPLHAIVGGYHLVNEQEANIKDTVQDLKALNPDVLLPGHCSGWRVKYEIEKELPGRLVPCTVGSRFTF